MSKERAIPRFVDEPARGSIHLRAGHLPGFHRLHAGALREVERIRKATPPKAEMDRAKQQVRSWYRYEHDGVTYQGMLLSTLEALSGWDAGEGLLAKIDRVRAGDVREVARHYLVEDRRSVVRFHAQEAAA